MEPQVTGPAGDVTDATALRCRNPNRLRREDVEARRLRHRDVEDEAYAVRDRVIERLETHSQSPQLYAPEGAPCACHTLVRCNRGNCHPSCGA